MNLARLASQRDDSIGESAGDAASCCLESDDRWN